MNQWKIVHNDGTIEPKQGTYEADPFLFEHGGKLWLFYELYDYKKGVIAVREFPDGEPQVILERSHHLSFPCVWEENGKIFMMPETGAGDLIILECEAFPDRWVEVYRRGGNFGDSVYYDGHIFTTEGSDHNLRIFRSGELAYAEPRMNSRCAGHLFTENGVLVRPTQLGEGGYGMGVILKSIDLNSPTFEERELRRILPTGNETGLHTYNTVGNVTVWDVRYKL